MLQLTRNESTKKLPANQNFYFSAVTPRSLAGSQKFSHSEIFTIMQQDFRNKFNKVSVANEAGN